MMLWCKGSVAKSYFDFVGMDVRFAHGDPILPQGYIDGAQLFAKKQAQLKRQHLNESEEWTELEEEKFVLQTMILSLLYECWNGFRRMPVLFDGGSN